MFKNGAGTASLLTSTFCHAIEYGSPIVTHHDGTFRHDKIWLLDIKPVRDFSDGHRFLILNRGRPEAWTIAPGQDPVAHDFQGFTPGHRTNSDPFCNFRLGADGKTATAVERSGRIYSFWQLGAQHFERVAEARARDYQSTGFSKIGTEAFRPRRPEDAPRYALCPATGRVASITQGILQCVRPGQPSRGHFLLPDASRLLDSRILGFSPCGEILALELTHRIDGGSASPASRTIILLRPYQVENADITPVGMHAYRVGTAPLRINWRLVKEDRWECIGESFNNESLLRFGGIIRRHFKFSRPKSRPAKSRRSLQNRDRYLEHAKRPADISLLGEDPFGNMYHILRSGDTGPCTVYRRSLSGTHAVPRALHQNLAAQLVALYGAHSNIDKEELLLWAKDGGGLSFFGSKPDARAGLKAAGALTFSENATPAPWRQQLLAATAAASQKYAADIAKASSMMHDIKPTGGGPATFAQQLLRALLRVCSEA